MLLIYLVAPVNVAPPAHRHVRLFCTAHDGLWDEEREQLEWLSTLAAAKKNVDDLKSIVTSSKTLPLSDDDGSVVPPPLSDDIDAVLWDEDIESCELVKEMSAWDKEVQQVQQIADSQGQGTIATTTSTRLGPGPQMLLIPRRMTAAAAVAAFAMRPGAAFAARGLKATLDLQDSKLLTKPNGMANPSEAAYPSWLEGEWKGTLNFAGYELPAKDVIKRDELFGDVNVPGFTKTSIALLSDVGKEGATMSVRYAKDGKGLVREDRVSNLRSAVRGGLGYDAIERIDYKEDPNNPFGLGSNTGNVNRLKLVFAPGLTKNAERIELFVNARETEQPENRPDLFYLSESIRQVTFSNGQQRQVNGEYAHFQSFRKVSDALVESVIVTAVYADPLQLERLFIKAGPSRPLIVFSHNLRLEREA